MEVLSWFFLFKKWRFGTWKKDRWEIFIHSHFSRFLSWLIPFVESLTFSSLWNLCSHWLSFQECELLVQCVPEFYENLLDEKLEIPSFICLLARLALLCVCVVNRISVLQATNKIPTIKSFPCSWTTTIAKKKKLSFIIPEHKSLKLHVPIWKTEVAQKGLERLY